MRIGMGAVMLAVVMVVIPSPAHAYLDPGAGSVLLQGLIAAAAAVTAVLSVNLRRVKSLFRRLFGRRDDERPRE